MSTKIIIPVLILVFSAFSLKAQVAINTDNTTANSSAMLDVKSTSKGMLIPRMTTAQRTAISSPANGLMVYDETTNSFWFYDSGNSGWTELVASTGASELDDLSDAKTDNESVFLGTDAGTSDNGGNYNVAIGIQASKDNINGKRNTAIGNAALRKNYNGSDLVAIGDSALYNNYYSGPYTTYYSNRNTAVGSSALLNNVTGEDNTAFGYKSLYKNHNASNNTAVGNKSLYSNTSGINNVAIGYQASKYNSTGNNNVSLGYNSAYWNSTGSNNLVLGFQAGVGTNGQSYSGCVLLGNEAGSNNANNNKLFIDNSSTSLPLIGGDFSTDQVDINGTIKITGGSPGAGKVLTSDADGLASWSTTSIDNLSNGRQIDFSYYIGDSAGINDVGSFSSWGVKYTENVGMGYMSLKSTTTGNNNCAIGSYSAERNTVGYNNTSLGYKALRYNETGDKNTAIGHYAGYGSSGVSYNGCVFIGNEAGFNNTSSDKLFIDNSSTSSPLIGGDFSTDQVDINGTIKITGGSPGAGKVLTSDADGLASWTTPSAAGATKISDLSDANTDNQSVFLGTNAGAADDGSNYNTAVGINGLHNTTSGTKNTSIGYAAGNANITGTDNTYLGYAGGYYNTGSENTTVGVNAGRTTNGNSYDGCVLIGFNAGYNNTSSNKLFIANSNTSTPLIGGDFSTKELYLNTTEVGIGTDSPNEELEVAGISGNEARMIVSDGMGSNRNVLLFVSPDASSDYGRIEAYKYGTSVGGRTLKLNTTGNGNIVSGGNFLPVGHKSKDIGANGNAWDNVYADDFVNQGAAAFANISVTQELLDHQPQEKKDGAFDEFTDKGAKELDPASLPESLTQENSILIDEMTTYNYKANYEQQQQLEALKKENVQLKALLLQLEQRLSAIENDTQESQR